MKGESWLYIHNVFKHRGWELAAVVGSRAHASLLCRVASGWVTAPQYPARALACCSLKVSTHRGALLLRYCKEVKKCGNGVKFCAYCACVTFHTLLEVSEGVLRAGEVTIRQKRVTRAVHPYMAILVWKLFTQTASSLCKPLLRLSPNWDISKTQGNQYCLNKC